MENIKEVEIINPYGFIYITTNIVNGKKYIGQRRFYKDWEIYLGSGKILKMAFKKYGKENFIREIVAIGYSKEELNKLEIEYIKDHNAVENDDYYNIKEGGLGGSIKGRVTTEEAKVKISLAEKGKKVSEETKKKLSKSLTGKKFSEERKKRMSEISSNISDETRLKMSLAQKGKIISEETKLKLSKVSKGRKHPDDTKLKMSQTSLNMTEETKRKISLARLKNNKAEEHKEKHITKIFSEEHRRNISKAAKGKNKKFNNEIVKEIRNKYSTGEYGFRQLAEEYNCDHTLISRIINRKGAYKDY